MNTNKYIEEAMANIEYYGTCTFTEGKPDNPPKLLIQVEEKHLRKVLSEALTAYRDDLVDKLEEHVKNGDIDMVHTNLDNLIKELTE